MIFSNTIEYLTFDERILLTLWKLSLKLTLVLHDMKVTKKTSKRRNSMKKKIFLLKLKMIIYYIIVIKMEL